MDDLNKNSVQTGAYREQDTLVEASRTINKALLKASRTKNNACLTQARLEWNVHFGEGALLAWAAENLSSWAVGELMKLGEPVSMIAVMSALNQLDMHLAWGDPGNSDPLEKCLAWRGMKGSNLMEIWDLFLPSVQASIELRKVTIECLLRRNIPGLNEKSRLSWTVLKMDHVFQDDLSEALFEAPLPLGGLELIQGLGNEEPTPCFLAPLQIAWEQGRPDICLSLLEQGLSVQTQYAESLWPTWTLEQAVLDPSAWVATLTGDAEARACAALNAYHRAGPNPALALLAKTIRQQRLDQSLPAPTPLLRGPRF